MMNSMMSDLITTQPVKQSRLYVRLAWAGDKSRVSNADVYNCSRSIDTRAVGSFSYKVL